MRLWRRFLQLVQRRSFEADLAEELRIHREMAEASAVRAGATPEEARREAGRDFGGVALALEDSRAVWRSAWLSSLMQDIRFGLRGFRKSPGFALTVVGTLALGLGTLGASFSVFNALVLRPFAVRDPYSLYTLLGWGEKPGNYQTRSLGWHDFNDLRRRNTAFSEILGSHNANDLVDGKFTNSQAVTGNYFTMLGGRVCMGRPVLESDDAPGNGVAVASYAAWKRYFGGSPGVIGRKLRVGNRSVEIVGVACPEFNGLEVRIALGAGNAEVIGLVLKQSLRFAVAGAALGTFAALALARAISVPRLDLFDPGGYVTGALVVMASAIAAAWIPARRAVRVDPAETLRCD
jgi:hypothetical protein